MGKHSDETMQKIWGLNILDVADKLEIKYSGKGVYRKCKCFMHDDKHPSMWFKTSNNTWSCPVCNKGGGLVTLVMEHEGLSFHDAVDWLIKAFDIWVYDDNDKYRPLKSKSNQKNISRKNISNVTTQQQATMNLLDPTLTTQCMSTETTFCRALVSTGILTESQMRHAADIYRLGATKDGGVIFWNIDQNQQLLEGKIMWYLDDCHRDHHHNPSTISSRLIAHGKLPKEWTATNCLFGLHLINVNEGCIIAVVESEKTAVICSQLIPSMGGTKVIWMASGGKGALSMQLLQPVLGKKVILFPDTDTTGECYNSWLKIASQANSSLPSTAGKVFVSNLLELHATDDQKRRKIDIADFIDPHRPSPALPLKRGSFNGNG